MKRHTLANLARLVFLFVTIALTMIVPNSGQGQGGTFGHNSSNGSGTRLRLPLTK